MKLDWKTCFKLVLSAFVLYLGILYWPAASGFLQAVMAAAAPLIFGVVLAYAINILMSLYERIYFPKTQNKFLRKSRRPVCLLLGMLTLVLVLVVVLLLVVPQLAECFTMAFAALPGLIADVIDFLDKYELVSDDLLASLSAIDWQSRLGQLAKMLMSGVGNVMSIVISTVGVIISGFFALVFSIYILADKEHLGSQLRRLLQRYLPRRWFNKVMHVATVVDECMHNFLVGQCIEAVILGTLCFLGMKLLGLPYAGMVGPLVAVTALIPVLGAFIGGGIGFLVIFLESPLDAIVFLIFLLVLQQIEGNLIYPRVVGNSVGLPGIWVLAVVLIAGAVSGVVGMIFAVPLTAAVYKLIREDVNKGETTQEVAVKE